MAKKTWQEKFNSDKPPIVKVIDKKFADMPAGTNMFIATPKIIDAYVNHIPSGVAVDILTMRKDLAAEYEAEKTCPVTTSIFLRIASEVAFEKYQNGSSLEAITPFWRVVSSKMSLAKKLACGVDFIKEQRMNEELS
ncbi:hypothetical protein RQM59_07535 [Flavobacteriaceae bacterium S356]|uniref:Uncharacterized protein n=1 Tax=Asprobacillus argus TaxID=3076534 RepID=A0ABU3LGP2_9FLAO|nr:hypothetical protein [Flavobacteriaceae bacterium S356]